MSETPPAARDDLPIERGSEVILHCRVVLEDGRVAEDTHAGDPLCVRIGDGALLDRLENLLLGLHAGARRAWDLPPEEAFGEHDPANVRELPLEHFPERLQPVAGQVISFSLPDGNEVPGTVIEVIGDRVQVDFNHPFAGHAIRFEVDILAVAETP